MAIGISLAPSSLQLISRSLRDWLHSGAPLTRHSSSSLGRSSHGKRLIPACVAEHRAEQSARSSQQQSCTGVCSHSFTHPPPGLQLGSWESRTSNLQLVQFPLKCSNTAPFHEALSNPEWIQSPFPPTGNLLQPKSNAPKSMGQSQPDLSWDRKR